MAADAVAGDARRDRAGTGRHPAEHRRRRCRAGRGHRTAGNHGDRPESGPARHASSAATPWSRSPDPAPGSRSWSSHPWLTDTVLTPSGGAGRDLPPGHRCPARRHRPPAPRTGNRRRAGRSSRTAVASTLNRAAGFGADRVPAPDTDGQTDPGPRPALPVPRLPRRRRVLRPRPRPALAARPHPPTTTCSACADATTGSNNDPAGQSPSPPTAVATWTDPTGRVRTTHPVDALRTAVLTGSSPPPPPTGTKHQPGPHPDPRRPTQRARVPPRTPRHRPTGPPTNPNTGHGLARRPRPPPPHRASSPRPAPSSSTTTPGPTGVNDIPPSCPDTDLPPF